LVGKVLRKTIQMKRRAKVVIVLRLPGAKEPPSSRECSGLPAADISPRLTQSLGDFSSFAAESRGSSLISSADDTRDVQ